MKKNWFTFSSGHKEGWHWAGNTDKEGDEELCSTIVLTWDGRRRRRQLKKNVEGTYIRTYIYENMYKYWYA